MKKEPAHGCTNRRRACAAVLGRCVLESLEQRCLLSTSVLQWSGGPTGNSLYPNETILTPSDVNASQFGLIKSIALPGGSGDQVYAQPLYVNGLTITGRGALNGTHNVVIVATEANNVYAFDTITFQRIWSINLGAPIPYLAAGGPNFNNFTGSLGVTGTPVIDPATNRMYLDSTQETSAGVFIHKIFEINITNGTIVNSVTLGNVAGGIVPEIPGTSSDAVGGMDEFTPQKELQRPGLMILNGVVYVAYGSYGDSDPYHGWVLGFSESSLALTAVFDTTPNQIPGGPTGGSEAHDGEGAIWMSGAEITTDGTSLFLVTGNGDFDPDPSYGAYGDTVLKLGVTSTTSANPGVDGYGLAVADYFTPYNEAYLGNYQVDLDLGTSGAMLLPTQGGADPDELIMIGKQGVAYLIDRDDMGEFNTVSDDVVDESGVGGMWGTPTYFNNTVYFSPSGRTLEAFSLVNGALSAGPVASGAVTLPSEGATPVISSNGNSNGIVWEIANNGILYAYDASTLQEIYSSSVGAVDHFAVPVVADGLVFAAGQGTLDFFGETSLLTSLPGMPTNFGATPLSGSQVQINWTTTPVAGMPGITPFIQIDRSVGTAGAFTPLMIVSGTLGSYTDTGLTAGTQYQYEIQEIDTAGKSSFTVPAGVIPVFGTVMGRNVFYNDSVFDGDDPAPTLADGAAIDTSKTALLPGGTATFANYTSYADGLNGISIDISNVFTPANITLADFVFMTGNDSNLSDWTTALTPDGLAVFPGAGAGGSTRIEFVWNTADAVQNAWLQVTVAADGDTNLASPDVFYFGNAIGESGDSPTDALVNATDEIEARANAATGVPVTDPYDYNKDGNVDSTDEAIARNNQTYFLNALQLITVPETLSLVPAGQTGADAGAAIPAGQPAVGAVDEPQILPLTTVQAGTPAPAIHRKPAKRGAAHVQAVRSAAPLNHAQTPQPLVRKAGQIRPSSKGLVGRLISLLGLPF